MARFVYRDSLYGVWVPADPGAPMMVPNPGQTVRKLENKET